VIVLKGDHLEMAAEFINDCARLNLNAQVMRIRFEATESDGSCQRMLKLRMSYQKETKGTKEISVAFYQSIRRLSVCTVGSDQEIVDGPAQWSCYNIMLLLYRSTFRDVKKPCVMKSNGRL
jgi:hypothetical protein